MCCDEDMKPEPAFGFDLMTLEELRALRDRIDEAIKAEEERPPAYKCIGPRLKNNSFYSQRRMF